MPSSRSDQGRALKGPCFCDKLCDEVCRLHATESDAVRTVQHISCDECGKRFRRVTLKMRA
jgi:hypothetical protein